MALPRCSWTSSAAVIRARSRARLNRWAAFNEPSKAAVAAGSPAIAVCTCAVAASCSAARAVSPCSGEACSSAWLIAAIAASAVSGSVPQVSLRSSHSFGPWNPHLVRNVSNAATNATASGWVSACSASSR